MEYFGEMTLSCIAESLQVQVIDLLLSSHPGIDGAYVFLDSVFLEYVG